MLRNKNFQSYNSGNNWKEIVTTLIKRTAVTKTSDSWNAHKIECRFRTTEICSTDVQYGCTVQMTRSTLRVI